ncbi:hypothetical protein [Rhizobium tumorigenes]|uniref:hypothetical protein n=1 Tax=Rhizobium tumorigenes TaxID=2041385 RepID=UPI00241FF995|nr:hypothetical protein [Rhizobium tumorigenes]WFS04461.1 hypothetical protein PR016_25715 [Rhizobium tumorigenes]
MSKMVVIGLPGEDGLWLADLGAGTVTAVEACGSSALKHAIGVRESGEALEGVVLAVAFSGTADVASGFLDG